MLNNHQISYLKESELLSAPLKELDLSLKNSWVQPLINQVQDELKTKNIFFKPNIWISDEWFCPDGITGFALPFYLLHPRLIKLEKKNCLQAEGETKKWCLQLLRHEYAHALDNAFHLRKKKKRQSLFGISGKSYPEKYSPKTQSKDYVIHLEGYYAQAHPAEDWAETFAIWLNPTSNWEKTYKNWPAIKKLKYMDEVMTSISGKRPLRKNNNKIDLLENKNITLKDYFNAKKIHLKIDQQKKSLEKDIEQTRISLPMTVALQPGHQSFLRRHRSRIANKVMNDDAIHEREIQQIIEEMSSHCLENHYDFQSQDDDQLIGLISKKMTQMIRKKNKTVIM